MGAFIRSVPNLENWHIWGMRRIRALGRFPAGLGASEGCGHERVRMTSRALPVITTVNDCAGIGQEYG